MTNREWQRASVIKLAVDGEIQVKRLKRRYEAHSAAGMAHGSRGRPSRRRIAPEVVHTVIKLATGKYAGFNDVHLTEKLIEEEGLKISVSSVCRILRAHFQSHEDVWGYLKLLRSIVEQYGIPLAVYSDRHSIFSRNDNHWTKEEQLRGRQDPTQVARAMEQAQPVLDRFLPDYNRRFAKAPAQAGHAFRLPGPGMDLDRVFCVRHQRLVSNDNTVRIEGRVRIFYRDECIARFDSLPPRVPPAPKPAAIAI